MFLPRLGYGCLLVLLVVFVAAFDGGEPATKTQSRAGEPLITEFMAANGRTLADEDGDFSDWIEIHNPTDVAIDLEGWALTDDDSALSAWTFPSIMLEAGEYLVVFASGKDRRSGTEQNLHTSFSLNRDGEYLALVNPAGEAVSEYAPFPDQQTDVSYGPADVGMGNFGATFFDTPTPGAANVSGLNEFVDPPSFSAAHGSYEDPFSLFLFPGTPGSSIRYTMDGSRPTETTGSVYTAPLLIDRTTVVRAAGFKPGSYASEVVTRTFLFLKDVIHQSADGRPPGGWPSTWGRNDVDYGMDPDVVNGNEQNVIDALNAIPSFSIAMELDSLFNPTMGIYANALEYGRAWERPASIELLYPDGFYWGSGAPAYHGAADGFQVDAGVRIRGGWSRNTENPKHAFRLFFRGVHGPTMLSYALFGDEGTDRFDKFDLRTAQNYSWSYYGDTRSTFLRDVFARDTQRDMSVIYTRSRYCHLYLNGQYWGLFQTQERADGSHGAAYLGGEDDDFDVIKSAGLDNNYEMEATAGNLDAWRRLWEGANRLAAALTDARRDELFLELQGLNPDGSRRPGLPVLLDPDNLINYMLVIFWTGNPDAPITPFMGTNNFFAIRDRTGDSGFVYFAHDSEHTLLPENGGFHDRIGPFPAGDEFRFSNPQWIHQQLMGSREYRLRFADLARTHLFNGGALVPDRAVARWNARAAEVGAVMLAESARWGDAQTATPLTTRDWAAEVERVRNTVLPSRTDVVLGQLKRARRYSGGNSGAGLIDAPLYPAVAAPDFSHYGGEVPAGFSLEIDGPSGAAIYYTLDGSDPRRFGGEISGSAARYEGNPLQPVGRTRVKARAKTADDWSALTQAEFFVDTARPSASTLAITEIYYNPAPVTPDEEAAGYTPNEAFEFVELHNTSASKSVDLEGVTFSDGIEITFTDAVLAPGERAVVVGNPAAFEHRFGTEPRILGTYLGRLDNAGEVVTLLDRDGSTIHTFSYNAGGGWPTRADGRGSSLELIDPELDYSRSSSWRAGAEYDGSPGREGSGSRPDIVVNEVLTHTDEPDVDAVELHNLTDTAVDISGWYLRDSRESRTYVFPDGTSIEGHAYSVVDERDFNTSGTPSDFAFNGAHGDEVWLVATDPDGAPMRFVDQVEFGGSRNGESFGRWPDGTGELFPMLESTFGEVNSGPRAGIVILREIMYHPPGNNPNLEYLILLNTGTETESMTSWRLHDGVEFTFRESDPLLAPGDSLVVVSFDPILEPEKASTFRAAYGWPESLPLVGGWTGRLANEGEALTLTRPDEPPTDDPDFIPQTIEERVVYDDEAPWPSEAAGDGASLRRSDDAGFSGDPAGWYAQRRPFELHNSSVGPEPPPIPGSGFVLSSTFPNPAADRAAFTLAVGETQNVHVTLIDVLGRRVRDIFAGTVDADRVTEIPIDGSDLASGLYLVQIVAREFSATRTVTFIR